MRFLSRLRRRVEVRDPAAYAGGVQGSAALRAAIERPVAGSQLRPVCSACGKPLESRTPPAASLLRPVYAGVVCQLCSWVECKNCKGSPSDAPCAICGSPVMPAQVALFA